MITFKNKWAIQLAHQFLVDSPGEYQFTALCESTNEAKKVIRQAIDTKGYTGMASVDARISILEKGHTDGEIIYTNVLKQLTNKELEEVSEEDAFYVDGHGYHDTLVEALRNIHYDELPFLAPGLPIVSLIIPVFYGEVG